MGYVKFDDEKADVVYVQPSDSHPKRGSVRFPIGRPLIRFLDIDFQPYERARKRLLEQASSGLTGPAAVVAEAAKLVRTGLGSEFGRHPYFHNIRLNEEDSDRDTALEWLKTHDYLDGQHTLAIAVQLCLDADGPIHLVSFSARERYLIARALDAFQLPVQPESLQAGFSFTDPSQFSAIKALLEKSGDTAEVAGGQRLGRLGVSSLVRLKDHFQEYPPLLSEGYSDGDPMVLATAEFMKMVQLDLRVRRCAHCGRFLLLRGSRNIRYCDRVSTGDTRTCQAIGAATRYRQRVREDPLMRAYTRAYHRKYRQMRTGNHSDTHTFHEWEREASRLRDSARDGKADRLKTIEWLNRS